MNYKSLAKIACRTMSIYFFSKFIIFLSFTVYPLFNAFQRFDGRLYMQGIISTLSTVAAYLFVSIALWLLSDKISCMIVGRSKEANNNIDIEYKKMQNIAFSVVGLSIFVTSIPDIITTLITIYEISSHLMGVYSSELATYQIRLLGDVVRLLIGLFLLFGGKGILNMITKLRTVGISKEKSQ